MCKQCDAILGDLQPSDQWFNKYITLIYRLNQLISTVHLIKGWIKVKLVQSDEFFYKSVEPYIHWKVYLHAFFCSLDCLSVGLFNCWTVCPLDCLSVGLLIRWTVYTLDCLSVGLFIRWTVNPLDCLSVGLFIRWTVYPLDCLSIGLFIRWTVYPLDCLTVEQYISNLPYQDNTTHWSSIKALKAR